MSLSCGIVGLPNSGKSTLFNALLKKQIAQIAEYPYTTIGPNVGVVEVPDRRLDKIVESAHIEKKVPAVIKFIDIAGLIKGAHQGEGLGNQFLAHIREVDAILHVVRAFDPSTGSGQVIPHVMGEVNPVRDVEVVNFELELGGIKKPTVYVLNVSESALQSPPIQLINQLDAVVISAKLEAELSELSKEEQREYLRELGVEKSSLDQVILASYELLDLITFFTIAGGNQAQAWPIKKGSTAIEAAEKVHTDFAKGFINCEVLRYGDLLKTGSWTKAKEEGLVKIQSKDHVVEDGDILEFHAKV